MCGCQSRACGDDSVKHLRVRSLPCRNPSSSFAACADFLLLILNSCRFVSTRSCMLLVVHQVMACVSCSRADSFCKVQLRSLLLLL